MNFTAPPDHIVSVDARGARTLCAVLVQREIRREIMAFCIETISIREIMNDRPVYDILHVGTFQIYTNLFSYVRDNITFARVHNGKSAVQLCMTFEPGPTCTTFNNAVEEMQLWHTRGCVSSELTVKDQNNNILVRLLIDWN